MCTQQQFAVNPCKYVLVSRYKCAIVKGALQHAVKYV